MIAGVEHIPPLRPAPNPTARLVQEFAERGILIKLDESGELLAHGRFLVDGEIYRDDEIFTISLKTMWQLNKN